MVSYISPNEVNEDEDIIIDVRTPSEYHATHIPNSYNIPLDDLESYKDFLRHVEAVLICRTDNRSAEAWKKLKGVGATVNVVKNGINGWQDAGKIVEQGKGSAWSIQRQVQFTAGSLSLIGTVLGIISSPWFLLIPGFIGAGLSFAGLTGTCGLAKLLSNAPWNVTENVTEQHVETLKNRLKSEES